MIKIMKVKTKKIMSVICLLLILMTSLPLQTFAAFITDMNSNAEFGVIGGSLAQYGHELHYSNYDGSTYMLFCTQWGVKSPTGKVYEYGTDFLTEFKETSPQYARIAEMIYFGYSMKYGMGLPNSYEAQKAMCATQQYVWESLGVNPGRDTWNANYMSSGIYASWLADTQYYYDLYHGNLSFNGQTHKATIGQTTMLSDSSGRLAMYDSFNKSNNGVTFSHASGSNELAITVDNNCTADRVTFNTRDYGLYQLMPNGARYDSSTMSNYLYVHFNSGSVQNLMFSNYVDPSTFSVNVEVEYGNALVIKTNSIGNVLGGCTFELYRNENCTQKVRTGTSDNNGQIHFDRLAPGTYYVKEVSVPNGYLLDNTIQKVEVRVNETTEISFKNYEPTGELRLFKTDKETGRDNRADGTGHHGDATLEGTEYTLYAKENIFNVARSVKYFSKDEEIATFTFNANGIAKINISTSCKTANLTTDGDLLKGLPMGSYYAKETKIPEGYFEDTETHNITFRYKDMNTKVIHLEDTFKNQVQKAKFETIKVTSITNDTAPIVGNAEFTAILTKYVKFYGSFDEALKHLDEFSKDEYSVFRTELNGHGISGLLAYGDYTVNETYCPSDRMNPVKEFHVKIDKNSNSVIKELVENDTPFTSYLKMIKLDKKSGKVVTFSNTTFSLYKLNEETNEYERIKCKLGRESFDTWTTDEKGIAYTETKLDAGIYKIDEIKVPTGFLQLEEECTFEVTRSNESLEYDKDKDAYITVQVKNEQPTGTLIVDKSVAIRENVDTSLVDISDLSGIKFKLVAKEDVIDYADGSTIYKKGQEVKTFNLDKDGNYTITELPLGVYELSEVETLNGLVLNQTKYEVKFEQKDLITKVYEETQEIENDTTCVEISKTDITGESELEGAKLTILDEDGKVIDSWTSTDKTHKIEGLVVDKKYTLREDLAPLGYVKSTDIEFTIENTKDIQKVTMVDKIVSMSKEDIGGNEIEGAEMSVTDENGKIVDSWTSSKEAHHINNLEENKKYVLHELYAPDGFVVATDVEFTVTTDKETQEIVLVDKVVEISKVDISGKEIEGATLSITSNKTKNIIDKWVSTKEPHKVSGLIEGETYILHEEICVDGFVKASDVEFTVTSEKEAQKVNMIDKVVEITKTDLTTGEELEGAELQVVDKEGNIVDEWISSKEAHKVTGLEEGKDYTLIEKTCPYGYEQAESITFTVSYEKETQKIEMKDMPILKSVQVEKIDKDTGEHIKSNKFTFGIFEDEECTKLIKEVGANEFEGTALFEDLRFGTYYIKELKAPLGYKLSDQVVKIEINDKGVFADGVSLEENNEIYSFVYYNSLLPVVQTGNETNYTFLLLAAVIAITGIVGGTIYLKKRKNK